MDLWIRSQNKEILMKICDIAIDKNKIVGYFDKETEYETLGIYSSKERALEVLDEIQSIIKGKTIIKLNNLLRREEVDKLKNIVGKDGLITPPAYEIKRLNQNEVYEMPEE